EGLRDGWRSCFLMAASRGREQAGESDYGGFFLQALCDALEGKGVAPDEDGRMSAQRAWAHAADQTNRVAARHGHRQVAVSAGLSSPISLTRLAPDRNGRAAVRACRRSLVARYSEFVPFGHERPVNLARIYRDLAVYRQFSSPYYKSREQLVRELAF